MDIEATLDKCYYPVKPMGKQTEARKKSRRKYYLAHRQAILASNRLWQKNNDPLIREYRRRDYAKRKLKNPHVARDRSRKWRLTHRAESNEYDREYRKRNAATVKARAKAARIRNSEKIKAYKRKWYLANREKVLRDTCDYARRNLDLTRSRQKKWRIENAEALKAKRLKFAADNKDEMRRRTRETYKRYRAKLIARSKANYFKDHEKNKAWHREYYYRHKLKLLEQMRAYRLANREKISVARAEWFQNNKPLAYAKNVRRKAMEKAATIGDTDQISQFYLMVKNAARISCAYCARDIPMGWQRTVDHVVPLCRGGTHSIDNLTPCCRRCNCMKRDKTVQEFLAYLKQVACPIS